MIRELIGMASSFSSPRMSEFTKRMGDTCPCLEDLFERRLKRTDDLLSYNLTSASSNTHIKEWAE